MATAWAEFVPFVRFDTEIRAITCTTNAIEITSDGRKENNKIQLHR